MPFIYKTPSSADFQNIWMLMWSWGKIEKEWNSNVYYCQANISESPQSTLNNYIVSNGNIFPNLAQITNHEFQESTASGQKWSHGWVLSPVINNQCSLTRQESQCSCQGPGIPNPPGSHPGEGAQGSCPAHPLTLFSLTYQNHGFSDFSLFLLLPLVYIFLLLTTIWCAWKLL